VANSVEGVSPLLSDSGHLTNGKPGLHLQVQGPEQGPPDGRQRVPLAPAGSNSKKAQNKHTNKL